MPERKSCPKCGALYEVVIHRSIMRDKDSFDCITCGVELDSWSGGAFPEYKLITPGKKPDDAKT